MLSVAVLVQTPTPRGQVPANNDQPVTLPFTTVVTGDDLFMHIQVDPNQAGSNRFWLHLYHADGSPVGEVQLVQLRFTYRDLPLGQAKADLEPLGQDTFSVEGAYLSQAGAWDISAYIRRRGLDDSLLQLSLDVPPPAGLAAGTNPWQNPVPNLPAAGLAILGLVGLVAIPVVWRRPLQGAWPKAYRWLRGALFWLVLPGLLACVGWLILGLAAPSTGPPGENPVQASAASLEQGKALYSENCLPCHGPSGKGDGPAALALNPRPANLQVHVMPGAHSDAQLFDWITNGFPGTAMPAFGEELTEEQRWHVVNYIRTLAMEEMP
jgi:mono/diheme cytochrome c family protein